MDTYSLRQSLTRVLDYAQKREFSGYSKFDALNSPLLKIASLGFGPLRFIMTQSVMRFPINLRPILGVRKSRNPKGIGLFAQAYFTLYDQFGDTQHLEHGERLLTWLLENTSTGFTGKSWGYNCDWQNASLFYAPYGFPNCVTTVVCGEALLAGHSSTKKHEYLAAAREAASFIMTDLPHLISNDDEICIAYVPIQGVNAVINVNALAGAFLARLAVIDNVDEMHTFAIKLLRYVVNTQTDYAAWYYTDPPGKSYISHDNYHTGFILDGVLDTCKYAGVDEFTHAYRSGLNFYIKNLFEDDGAPRYMNDRTYPHDIHGAAQAIITLTKAAEHKPECLDMALKTASWTIEHMQKEDGSFIYQIGKFVDHNFTLMRWCNAWMTKALAELLVFCEKNSHQETQET